MKRKSILALTALLLSGNLMADVTLGNRKDLQVRLSDKEAEVVHTALGIFNKDYQRVFGRKVNQSRKADVLIATLGMDKALEKTLGEVEVARLKASPEGFLLKVKGDKLYVVGSDKRGTAYGILELSRMIGVSPWEWWADSPVQPKDKVVLKDGFIKGEAPSVAHRGIFINDEDFGLMPWSSLTYEPSETKGEIGPRTHERIFELLLRLRANTFWPAMHKCSVAFYLVPGNKEVADKYGIIVGTSHCEPMVRNTNAEWDESRRGKYDYVHNRDSVLRFWEERVRQLAHSDNLYTLGIRGVHDGAMQGAKTLPEQKAALTRIIKDQRDMLAKYLNPDVTKVPQVFIPYKEVLDVYNMGLEVPDDVALIWCDDNYGYIRHFPTPQERARKGGNGVYYHISYWGRPHDYLWLATNHPAQLYTQMKQAYDKGARSLWILNVGDIKPGEYLTELFFDMAWNIDGIADNEAGLTKHLTDWMAREFGQAHARELADVMNEYYRLAYIRKPEFMGHTRTEEKDPAWKVVSDLPWSKEEIEQRLHDYEVLSDKVKTLSASIPAAYRDAWFELVEYPVCASAEMNKKTLYGQLARHGLADWQQSDKAFDKIVELTQQYNSLNHGKWNRMMNYQPRKLAVFQKLPHTQAKGELLPDVTPLCLLNGKDFVHTTGKQPVCHGLGYQRGAVSLPMHSTVTYEVKTDGCDSIVVELALAPNHPVEGGKLRYTISVDGDKEQTVDFSTKGRSEEWKENVLTNQAHRRTVHLLKSGRQQAEVKIKALDEGVVIDQIKVWKK